MIGRAWQAHIRAQEARAARAQEVQLHLHLHSCFKCWPSMSHGPLVSAPSAAALSTQLQNPVVKLQRRCGAHHSLRHSTLQASSSCGLGSSSVYSTLQEGAQGCGAARRARAPARALGAAVHDRSCPLASVQLACRAIVRA